METFYTKQKKKDKNDDNKRKYSKNEIRILGEELLSPQASSKVTPRPPAPNCIRGVVFRGLLMRGNFEG